MNFRRLLTYFPFAFIAFIPLAKASFPASELFSTYSADGIFDKPVVLVEGYDPLNEISPSDYYVGGFNHLIFGGRDLAVVKFTDGGASLDQNALQLQQIIQLINAKKIGDHPIAVIGYSMGGIVAKKALKNIELMGSDHQASIYVSYDAPHLGANAPRAIQDTVESLINEIDSKTAGYTPSGLKRARKYYNSPAAREMLIGSPDQYAFDPSSFPDNLARVAVTSGSLAGNKQAASTSPGQMIADFKFYLVKNSLATWSESFTWYSEKIEDAYYDNVPGSYLDQYYDAFDKLKQGADYVKVYHAPESYQVTFVPTVSSLAITASPTEILTERFKYDSPFDKYIAIDTSGQNACAVYDLQSAEGQNWRHDYYHYSQLDQIRCALNQYHKKGSEVPNRFLKLGRQQVAALIMIPINHLLL